MMAKRPELRCSGRFVWGGALSELDLLFGLAHVPWAELIFGKHVKTAVLIATPCGIANKRSTIGETARVDNLALVGYNAKRRFIRAV